MSLFFLALIGGAAFLFVSVARRNAAETPWSDIYRLRDPVPPGMVQDLRAARNNRNFESGFGVAKDKVLSYVFGSSTVAHLGPGSGGDMQNDVYVEHGVEVGLSRGSAYVQRGDVSVKVTARGLTVTPHGGSRFLAAVEGKDLLVHCIHGDCDVGVGKPPEYGWSVPVHEGKTYRFPEKSREPVESDIPAEARALDEALRIKAEAQ